VAPPIKNIGLKPIIESRIIAIIVKRLPKCKVSDVGSNPT